MQKPMLSEQSYVKCDYVLGTCTWTDCFAVIGQCAITLRHTDRSAGSAQHHTSIIRDANKVSWQLRAVHKRVQVITNTKMKPDKFSLNSKCEVYQTYRIHVDRIFITFTAQSTTEKRQILHQTLDITFWNITNMLFSRTYFNCDILPGHGNYGT